MITWTRPDLFDGKVSAAFLPRAVRIDPMLVACLASAPWSERERTNGLKTDSLSFGTTTRNLIRGDYCRPAKLLETHPDLHRSLEALASSASAIYRERFAERFDAHFESLRCAPEYLLGGSPWNAGTVNRTKKLGLHRDSGNTPTHWTAITWITDSGTGPLVVPSLGIEIHPESGDLFLFDGATLEHGVPYSSGERYSVVFYTRSCPCLPHDEELRRFQRLCTKREIARAGGVYVGSKPELKRLARRALPRLPGL